MAGYTVAELVAKLRLDSSEFDRGMANAARNMQTAGKTMQSSSKSMSSAASAMDGVTRSSTGLTKATVAGTAAQSKFGTATQANGKHLGTYNSNIQQAEKSTGRFASFLSNNATMAMSGFVKGIGAMAGAMVLWESVSYTGRVEEMNIALERVSKNVGWTTDQIHDQISAIKEMGITTDVAQYTLSQFARANLDVAKASELARVAQDAAIFAGRDSSETLRWLIYGVQTYQTEIFRTQGLNVNVGKSFENYAKSVNKSAAALTESERQQAVLNEVLKTGATIAGAYEAAMESGSKQMRSMPRYFTEIKEAIGAHLLPAFTAAVFGVKDLIKGFRDAISAGGAFSNLVGAFGAGISGAFGLAASVGGKFLTWLMESKAAATALAVVISGMLAKSIVTMATNLAMTSWAFLASGARHYIAIIQQLTATFREMGAMAAATDLVALLNPWTLAILAVGAAVAVLGFKWMENKKRQEEATQAAKDWVELRQKAAGISDSSPIGEQLGFTQRNIATLESQIATLEEQLAGAFGLVDARPNDAASSFGDWLSRSIDGLLHAEVALNAESLVSAELLQERRNRLAELTVMEEELQATIAATTGFVVEQGAALADVTLPTFTEDFIGDSGLETFVDLIAAGEDGLAQLQEGLASVANMDISTRKGMLEFSNLAEAAGITVPNSLITAANAADGFTEAQERTAAQIQRQLTRSMVESAQAGVDAGMEFTRVADILGIDLANATTKQMEVLQRWSGTADDATGVSVALSEAFTTLDADTSSLTERIGALGQITQALMTEWYGVENARQAFREGLDGFVEDYRSAEEEMTGSGSQLVQGLISQFAGVGQALANEGAGAQAAWQELSRLREQLIGVAEDAGITGQPLQDLKDHLRVVEGVHVVTMRSNGMADIQAMAQEIRDDITALTDDPDALSSMVENFITSISQLQDMPIQRRNLLEEWLGPMGDDGNRLLGQGVLTRLVGDDQEARDAIRAVVDDLGLLSGEVMTGGGLNQGIRDSFQDIQSELDGFMEQFPRQLTFYAEILPTVEDALASQAQDEIDRLQAQFDADPVRWTIEFRRETEATHWDAVAAQMEADWREAHGAHPLEWSIQRRHEVEAINWDAVASQMQENWLEAHRANALEVDWDANTDSIDWAAIAAQMRENWLAAAGATPQGKSGSFGSGTHDNIHSFDPGPPVKSWDDYVAPNSPFGGANGDRVTAGVAEQIQMLVDLLDRLSEMQTAVLGNMGGLERSKSTLDNLTSAPVEFTLGREIMASLAQVYDAIQKITTTPWKVDIRLGQRLFTDINNAAAELTKLSSQFDGGMVDGGAQSEISRVQQAASDLDATKVSLSITVDQRIFSELAKLRGNLIALTAKDYILDIRIITALWGDLVRAAKEVRALLAMSGKINVRISEGLFSDIDRAANEIRGLIAQFDGANIALSASFSGPAGDPTAMLGSIAGGSAAMMASAAVAQFGGAVTSGYRDPATNAAAGGSPTSYHLDASNPAQDIVTSNMPATFQWLRMTFGDGSFRELIHAHMMVKHGAYDPNGYGPSDHYDHIHLAKRGGIFSTATPAIIGEAGPEVVLPLSRHADMVNVLKKSGAAGAVAHAVRAAGHYDVMMATGGAAGLGGSGTTAARAAARRNALPPDLRNWLALIHRALVNPNRSPVNNRRYSDADQAWQTRRQQIIDARRQAYMLQQAVTTMVGMLGPAAGRDIKKLYKAGISISEIRSMVQAMKEWKKSYKQALVDITTNVGKAAASQAAAWGLPLEKIQEYAQLAAQFGQNVRSGAASQTDVTGYKSMRSLGSGRSYRHTAEWASGVRQLQSMGLDAKLVRQLAEAGPEAYREVRRILAGGASLIGQLNQQSRLINDTVDSLISDLVTKNSGPDDPQNVVTAGMAWGQKWADDFADGLMNSPAIMAAATAFWNQMVQDVMDNAGIAPDEPAAPVRPLRTMSSHQFLQAYVNKQNNNEGPYTRAQLNEELRRRMGTPTQDDLNINDPILTGAALAAVRNQYTYWLQHRATGGSLRAGQPAIVGEYGRELFVPASDGYVVPNGQAMRSLLSDSGFGEGTTSGDAVRRVMDQVEVMLSGKGDGVTNHFHVAGFIDRDTVAEIGEAQEWSSRKAKL